MNAAMRERQPPVILLAAAALGVGLLGCVVGLSISPGEFYRAWLCSFLFWLGLPLAGVTLTLVHDLTGGEWMEAARPALNAAIATMPLASLAGIPAFIGLDTIYGWTHPASGLGNLFYLNRTDFFLRYGAYVVVWNLLAAFAVLGPRQGLRPIAPRQSWISGLGLVALALSMSFAAIDWILSLEPKFWSSIFPYTQGASWFNTGMAMVVLAVASAGRQLGERRAHMADLARILLAMTMFWAYVEFIQYLIIWEENLRTEIPWYVKRLDPAWRPALASSAGLGFVLPFLVLLWTPAKRHRAIVAAMCVSILISRIADTWLLVMPEFKQGTPIWLDVAAVLALGGGMAMMFASRWRHAPRGSSPGAPIRAADHG